MQDLIISLNKNVLRISTVDKEAVLKTTLLDIPKEVADDTRIVDPVEMSKILDGLIPQVSSLNKNKLSLNFVMEVQDVFLRYITVSKTDIDVNEQIISEIKEKAPDIPLDSLYFSYKKIAPFVYQFVGVKKEIIENYMEVSNNLGVGLKSVIPWVLGLPKYEKVNDPAIFISKVGDRQMIALSELNGIFFADVYDKEKSEEEIQALIKELSFYKRSSPIKYVFTMNCDYLSLPGYEVKEIKCPEFSVGSEVSSGYEQNVIVNFLLDTDTGTVNNQLNVLNLLPLPVIETKSSSLVAAGSVFAILILVGGIYGGYMFLRNRNKVEETLVAQDNSAENTQVLSESVEQVTEETGDGNVANDNQETDPNQNLKKGNLKIRVENGAGVSGLAAKTKGFLEEFGYLVLNIDTADSTSESTQLVFKKEFVEEFKDLVMADMKDKFPDIEIKDDLPEDSDYDLLIIVGKSSEL